MHPLKPHTQPHTYSITLKSLLSLPFRICNPPPAIGKVRSCAVTPLIDVRLDDVLERQHLPPLGLKDFEEWLLFVEMSPENLYFILWLREYKQRYHQWKSQAEFHLRAQPGDDTHQYSSQLAHFYSRAKQTFFTPGSAYELNLTSALLAPFHKPTAPPYPTPESLRAVELDTRRTLEVSLRRFVHAQLNNVGNRRVMCGILAGIAFVLIGAAAPLAALFARHAPRWTRLTALPGLWLGLTVLFASLNGICMGVYLFGDLRQLRRFELVRPSISKPRPLPAFTPISHVVDAAHASPVLHRAPSINSKKSARSRVSSNNGIHISPPYYDAEAGMEDDGMDLYAPRPESALSGWDGPPRTDRDVFDFGPVDAELERELERQLEWNRLQAEMDLNSRVSTPRPQSPVLFQRPVSSVPSIQSTESDATVFTGTATFIHPFVLDPVHPTPGTVISGARVEDEDEDEALARAIASPALHQRVAPFDFDGLPEWAASRRKRRAAVPTTTPLAPTPTYPHPYGAAASMSAVTPTSTSAHIPTPFDARSLSTSLVPPAPAHEPGWRGTLGRFQERCGLAKWRLQVGYLEAPVSVGKSGRDGKPATAEPHWSSPYWDQRPGAASSSGGFESLGKSQGKHFGNGRRSADSEKTRMGEGDADDGEVWDTLKGKRQHRFKGIVDVLSASNSSGKGEREDDDINRKRDRDDGKWWRRRLHSMRSVPAFAVPLARILSPIVVRGQWEIVVRSALLAGIVALTICAVMLAVPER